MAARPKKLDGLAGDLAELENVTAQIAKLNTRKKEIEQAVRDALGAAESGTVKGVEVVTYARAERASFDESAFKKAHPVIARRFIGYKEVRTLLVKWKSFGEAGLRG